METVSTIVLVSVVAIALGALVLRERYHARVRREREAELQRRFYELAILKEVGDRIGYSLSLEHVVDIISGSLVQFMPYCTVSYVLTNTGRPVTRIDLATAVSSSFVSEVKRRMYESLQALTDQVVRASEVDERIVGALVDDTMHDTVRSYFNIPLVLDGKVVGVLNVAHTEAGLYREEEMTLLYKIVGQATAAVERLEQVVAGERSKLAFMVESLSDGIIMTDTHYRLLVINPQARTYLGLPQGTEVSELELANALGGAFDLRAVLEESIHHDRHVAVDDVRIGDRTLQVHVSAVHSKTGGLRGRLLGGVVAIHDISHEKALERMRQDFTSMLVHELRAPLDSIKKIGEMMRGDGIREDKATYDEYVSMIHASSSHMLELVNDLLDVFKIESGKFELAKMPTHIKQIVRERVRFFDALAGDARVSLSGFYGSGIPDAVECDPMRITQVMNNLISNAIKHTPRGGKVTVQLLTHRFGESIEEEARREHIAWFITDDDRVLAELPTSVICAVTDTGEGIPAAELDKLFRKFGQVRSGREVARSTGLGLVVVKGIVEAHGGRVGVSSVEGTGSTFYITLPISERDI